MIIKCQLGFDLTASEALFDSGITQRHDKNDHQSLPTQMKRHSSRDEVIHLQRQGKAPNNTPTPPAFQVRSMVMTSIIRIDMNSYIASQTCQQKGNAHLFSMLGKLRRQTATRGGFSHSSLSTNKDPLEGLLFEDIFEGGIGEIVVVVELSVGHGRGYFGRGRRRKNVKRWEAMDCASSRAMLFYCVVSGRWDRQTVNQQPSAISILVHHHVVVCSTTITIKIKIEMEMKKEMEEKMKMEMWTCFLALHGACWIFKIALD